jgi:hypothetical protein
MVEWFILTIMQEKELDEKYLRSASKKAVLREVC